MQSIVRGRPQLGITYHLKGYKTPTQFPLHCKHRHGNKNTCKVEPLTNKSLPSRVAVPLGHKLNTLSIN